MNCKSVTILPDPQIIDSKTLYEEWYYKDTRYDVNIRTMYEVLGGDNKYTQERCLALLNQWPIWKLRNPKRHIRYSMSLLLQQVMFTIINGKSFELSPQTMVEI